MSNRRCIARHSGVWCVEPRWFSATIASIRAGTMRVLDIEDAEMVAAPRVETTEDGIGVLHLSGPMMKGASKFGNVDTVAARKAIRDMAANTNIREVVAVVDSPGGSFDGTEDIAHDFAALARAKPTYAQVDGAAASAMYWLASQASGVYATPTSEVGSIGVYGVIEDSSAAAEAAGIKVHVISTGPYKGAGVDGVPVTDEVLGMYQESVNKANEFFLSAVAKGRGKSRKWAEGVADGRTWYAAEALELGLIDGVQRFDDTISMVRKARRQSGEARRRAMEMARLKTA